jgi:WD and tetratricopeptide repeats protein 1
MRTLQRYVGHVNIVTYIKEASFMGQDDAIIGCGSDNGKVFLFDSLTGELLRILWADREVANCVHCHPTLPVLATSGLEYVVRCCPP